ARAVLRGKRM
ncbi:hypothetical protein ETH_00016745, partial [Eimeria tenella]